ncbi:MAG: undecaprenyl/decaprenyl-phosphate alpha-N-acetylglucosaminyl 1-phosphate transferase [Chloroflexi bacterium]|nr:MAG: undecaprenyl/decaprenyl-phosphate alpha-N-acetylglucosaminyl 1-phosphate transferase [Chloroflexota bacterium]
MLAIIIIFLIALSLALVGTPWIRKLAFLIGFVDEPEKRKNHSTPMPLMGGVAIFGAAVAAVSLFSSQMPDSVAGVLIALSVVALVGLLDDRYNLPAWAKLAGQFVGFLVLALYDIRVHLPVPDVINYLITFIWLAGISNAINFLDNMDGLSAGISGVSASFILLLGLQNEQILVSAMAAAVLGACIGFLRFNFKPAKIFMGDAGALFLGFVLALLSLQLRFPENVSFVTWMVPVFILGLPIFDMTLVIISRLRRGVSPNTPGKDHTSHRLLTLGFSQREAVLILYLVSGVMGLIGIFITEATLLEGYAIGGGTAVLALYLIFRIDRQG